MNELCSARSGPSSAARRTIVRVADCTSIRSLKTTTCVPFEAMTREYAFSDAECIRYLAQLDRLGIIELRPLNRYRLKVAKGFRWLPHGPVMRYFREHVAADYLSGGFDGEGELIMLVHGEITPALAASFVERLQRVGQDFAQAHIADQRLPEEQRTPYTLLVGMRTWLFAAFRDLKRDPGEAKTAR